MRFKSFVQLQDDIAALLEGKKELEKVIAKLQGIVSRLPGSLREEAINEISGSVRVWLRYGILRDLEPGDEAATQTQEVIPSTDKPQLPIRRVRAGSLAADIISLFKQHKSLKLSQIVTLLMQMGRGENSENFRTIVNTAIWRRLEGHPDRTGEAVFVKDDEGNYSLIDCEIVIVERKSPQ